MSAERCPHGDETCPCQDLGDPCHYERDHDYPRIFVVEPCPNPTPELTREIRLAQLVEGATMTVPHCHVEGCGWTRSADPYVPCGLIRLRVDDGPIYGNSGSGVLDALRGSAWWACGLMRDA